MISISRKNRASRITLLGAALALVLGLAAPPLARSAPPSLPQSEEATFVAYNLRNYRRGPFPPEPDASPSTDRPKPDDEIVAVVTMISQAKPDILGLVEIGTVKDLTHLQTQLRDAGIDLPHATLNAAFDDDRRLALLSRFPIVATDHQNDLGYLVGPQRLPFYRGILDATIALTPDYQLRVLGVHLKSKRPVLQADQAIMRRHEAHLTRRHVESVLGDDPQTNLLLFGDFNATRNEAAILAIRGRAHTPGHLHDLRVTDDRGERWTYFWEQADQYSRIDYLFVSKGLLPEIVRSRGRIISHPNWLQASDHRPIVTAIAPSD